MDIAIGRYNLGRCSHCRDIEKCLLSHLNPEELSIWHGMLASKTYRKNDIVFWEDGEAEGLYLVCSGVVKLTKSCAGGQQQILRLLGSGSFLGLPPLISQRTHFLTAQAIDRTELNFIPRQGFLDFLERFPHFAFNMIDQLANQLRLARMRLRDFSCKTGRQRIADLLLWLGREFGFRTARGIEIGVEISRADLAGMAGLTTETTIRLLSSLRQEGILENGRLKRIVVVRPERLQEISDSGEPFDF